MRTSTHQKVDGATLKLRQREIEQRLAMFGLWRGPHRLTRDAAGFEENQMRRLCGAMAELGPVFTSFGIYMSTRVDLLAAKDCLELAALPDRAEESPINAIRKLINDELGQPLENIYLAFEDKPFGSNLLSQQHHAWLGDGQAVTVTVVHPEAEEFLVYDLQLLPILKRTFVGGGWTDSKIEEAIADFRFTLAQQIDFKAQAGALAMLAKDAEVFRMLRVPLVYGQLSTSRMLTVERLPGESLNDVLLNLKRGEGNSTGLAEEEVRYSLARRLSVAWLRQALLGSLFPVALHPANLMILPDEQITFTNGSFAGLTPEAKVNLWDYLVAVATENPDLACSCLLKQLDKEQHTIGEDELRQRFRQSVPFRDSEWSYSPNNDNLAEYFFLHWKAAGDGGFRPRPGLSAFYRGLFAVASIAHRLVPNRDAFREALQDVRLLAGMERFRELMSTQQLGEQMDKYFAIMMDLPQKLDEALTLVAGGNARLRLQVSKERELSERRNSATVGIALLAILAAFMLLGQHFNGVFGTWSDRFSAVFFILLGGLLLRAVSRG